MYTSNTTCTWAVFHLNNHVHLKHHLHMSSLSPKQSCTPQTPLAHEQSFTWMIMYTSNTTCTWAVFHLNDHVHLKHHLHMSSLSPEWSCTPQTPLAHEQPFTWMIMYTSNTTCTWAAFHLNDHVHLKYHLHMSSLMMILKKYKKCSSSVW